MSIAFSRTLAAPFTRHRAAARRASIFSRVNWLAVNGALLGLIACAGLGYIVVTTTVATRGFAIKKLEQRVEELRDAKTALSLRATALQSLTRLEERADGLQLTEVAQVEYLDRGGAVALSK